jgi:formylglycine-generating enzyme required for sulfatase activity
VILLAGAHRDLSEDLCEELVVRILAQTVSLSRGSQSWLRHLVMAGRLAFYMGDKLAEPKHQDVINALNLAMTDDLLKPPKRAEAADTLDLLKLPSDLYTLVHLPEVNGWVGRYPVTNEQYRRFLEADDFHAERFWTGFPCFASPEGDYKALTPMADEGLNWLRRNWDENKKVTPRYWNDPSLGIARRGVPVVGVSWYEANAYCKWLKEHWAEQPEARDNAGLTPGQIRLPTEREWIAAAGGDEPRRRFPWDDARKATEKIEDVLHCANVIESGIGRTTPVGMYPKGKSTREVWDLAGNAWEWQANYYTEKDLYGALRGGSFGSPAEGARLSLRYYDRLDGHWNLSGFRVFVSPS